MEYVISDLNAEPITGSFYEKELQQKFRIEKVKEKVINFMSNGKDRTIYLIVWLIKRPCIKMSQYFRKSFRSCEKILKWKLIFQIMQ